MTRLRLSINVFADAVRTFGLDGYLARTTTLFARVPLLRLAASPNIPPGSDGTRGRMPSEHFDSAVTSKDSSVDGRAHQRQTQRRLTEAA